MGRQNHGARIASLALASLVIACGPDRGSAPVGGVNVTTPPLSTGPTLPQGSATNAAQWQTALAALALPASYDQPRFEPVSLDAYNALLAVNWPELEPLARGALESQLQTMIAALPAGAFSVSLKSLISDLDAPPRLTASGQPPLQVLELACPGGAGRWRLELELEVTTQLSVSVFGAPLTVTVPLPVSASVSDLQVRLPVLMDLSRPEAPSIVTVAPPAVDFNLALSSSNPVLSQVSGALNQLLDPVLRAALPVAALVAQRELGLLVAQLPSVAQWGVGGPGLQAMSGALPLEPLAVGVSEEIQRHHIPHKNLFPAVFDQPDFGGQVVDYRHFGDSALWSGGYLASEAYRYDLTADPRALTGGGKVLSGLDLISRVVGPPYEGLLARAALPVSSPYHASLMANTSYFTGVVDGVAYGAVGSTSRDSYCGVFLGLGQAYHRMPALRADVVPVVDRLLDYLVGHGWMVYRAANQLDNPTGDAMSVTFGTTPQAVLTLATIGKTVNPARWGALHSDMAELAELLWFPAWASSQEVHEGYFGFSLAHMTLLSLFEFETDPGRYRAYLQVLRILTETVGHHQNPWFESVRALGLPGERATLAPQIREELGQWTLRSRRGFPIKNSQDPSVPTITYTATLPNHTGAPTSPVSTGPRPQVVAVYPVPIPKRPSTAFLWSSSPFDADYAGKRTEQFTGVDLLLPYWLSRSHNILP
jgi:hypothetical protein